MEKVLILGCGYVGSAIARSLHEQKYHVSIATRSQDKVELFSQFASEVILVDQLDLLTLTSLIADKRLIFLTIAPSYPSSGKDKIALYRSTYLETAQNLVQALKNNSTVKQVIYTSSTSVYNGEQEFAKVVTEDLELSPKTEEAKILLQTENELKKWPGNVCIFRLGEILGPGRELWKRLSHLKSPLPGTGQNIVNQIFVQDIVKAVHLAIEKNLGGIFNLCQDAHPTRSVLYQTICELYRLPPIQWDSSQASMHGGTYQVSSAKIREHGMVFGPYQH